MKPLDTEALPDGCVRVCLTENGFTACTIVSSWHLVEDKRRQLLDAITNQAIEAYEQHP